MSQLAKALRDDARRKQKERQSMAESAVPMNRRTVLQRGLAILAGLVGLDVVDPNSRLHAEVLEPPNSGFQRLRFYARRWQTLSHGHLPGELPVASNPIHRQGDLSSAIGGQKTGEFCATCFFPVSSFGTRNSSGANMELHTFALGEDTLFGMGSSQSAGAGQVFAILGGTGRFTGARGSYVISPVAEEGKQDYTEINITIINEKA